jgi:E3 ubiquitin ligase SMURF1/2/E3 ubiquitin-protein ligase NEDD4
VDEGKASILCEYCFILFHFMLSFSQIESGGADNQTDTAALISYSQVDHMLPEILPQDLQAAAALPFNDKCIWFMELIASLQRPWAEGHIRLEVHRNSLLEESFDQFMGITRSIDLHRWMRVQFIGELGIDAGGLEREWFTLLCEELFSQERGLFSCSAGETFAGSYHINPISHMSNPNRHLQYFQFTGRILAKAIMEQIVVPAMLSLPLRKQILSIPITFSDLEFVDVDLFRNLCWLRDMSSGVENLGLVFAVDYQFAGNKSTFELIEGGSDIPVTDDNKHEYLELSLRHRMLDSIMPQLQSFLKGFYEVLPPDLVSVFDYQELELLMCGLPTLDMDDWKRHTEYLGEYHRLGPKHKVIKWFWEVLETFTDEERVRLLQFVTGCGGLPAQGFKALQSNDGNFRKFNIQSIHKIVSIVKMCMCVLYFKEILRCLRCVADFVFFVFYV